MPPIADMIQQGSGNLWLFIPSAILLGALHGLEPGHSKTLMASFIIAIRGTIGQAVLLGTCAALSHSLIVWLLAATALRFGNHLIAEQSEPWFMLASGFIVIGIAVWMFWRTRQDNLAAKAWQQAPHGGKVINTGHGLVELTLAEDGHLRLYCFSSSLKPQVPDPRVRYLISLRRDDGSQASPDMLNMGNYLQSAVALAAPHAFNATLDMRHGDHGHQFSVRFGAAPVEKSMRFRSQPAAGAATRPAMATRKTAPKPAAEEGYQDAHERAHAEEIARRFAGREVSTGQIALFGLTGGLMPCPASVTILIICLHLKKVALGVTMVASFSLGLALSMVSVGVAAAWGAQQLGKRFGNLDAWARKTPYFSSGLMVLVGGVMAVQGLLHLR